MTAAEARVVFLALVHNHPDASDDPRRFASLLADRFEGRWRREAAVLGAAVQEGVPDALRAGRGPFSALAAPLGDRLVDERGFDAALARWAVASWGIALGLATEREDPATPAPRPAKGPAPGAVRVASEPPGATVELDGRRLGPAPLLVPDMASGTHEARCTLPGHVARAAQFEVRPGATTTVQVRLEPATPAPGTLQVRTVPPGAGIYVDSRYAGTTPVVVQIESPKTVAIEAVGPGGLRYREERAVVAGADEVLVIDLEAEAARQRGEQEARAVQDFGLLVLIAMVVSVIASILAAIFGSGSRPK